MSSGLVVLVVIVLAVVAGLVRMWRNAEARVVLLVAANEKLSDERQEILARLSREAQVRKKQSDELAAQRKRTDKTKKRNAKGGQVLPLGTGSRISDLTSQIERAERERDRSRAEREQLAQQVAQLEARLELSARAVEEASAAHSLAASATPAPVPSPDADLERVRAELAESLERATKLDDALRVAKETEERVRKRMNTQEQLYASVRAELEVKKDRLRTQEERIQRLEAFKVAVSD